MFITTHNIEEASQMYGRIAIINYSIIAAIDTPEKIKRTIKSLQSMEVSFEEPQAEALKHLENFPKSSEVIKEGDEFRIFTDDPTSIYSSI